MITPDQLKPCPFCGGRAVIDEDDFGGYQTVHCARCLTEGPVDLLLNKGGSRGADALLHAWNSRPEATALEIAISALAFIAEGYARGDVGHQDYRVKAAAAADDALVKIRAQLPGLAMPPLPDRTWGGFIPGSQEEDDPS
jgi:Lar family restriction alleviation protein